MNETAILVTARLKSTRLPMKVVKPILGRPMICHLLDRLKLAQIPRRIILCTSDLPLDDPLQDIAEQESVSCFRGDPDDVLLRLTHAAEEFGINTVVSCTADNPFVDPEYIDRLVEFHVINGNDYSSVQGLPFGVFSYVVSYGAMVRACELKAETDTEVWGEYFTKTGIFKTGILQVADQAISRPHLRLTVDTPEDFELVSNIFGCLFNRGEVFSLHQIVQFCDAHPELVVNRHIEQKKGRPIRVKDGKLTPLSARKDVRGDHSPEADGLCERGAYDSARTEHTRHQRGQDGERLKGETFNGSH